MNKSEYHAIYYEKNKAKAKAHKKRYEARNKRFVTLVKKRGECVKCGLKKWYLLEFHHINPKEKLISVTDLQFNAYSLERIKKEMKKCAILCRNCHMEYHHLEKQINLNTFMYYLNQSE